MKNSKIIISGLVITSLSVLALMFGLPIYNVWQQEMAGKAEMAKAEQNRKILIEEAKARLEADKLNALAYTDKTKGISEEMKLKNGTLNSNYKQYLFIRTLEKLADKADLPQIINMPAEGLVPTLDVSRKPIQQ